MIRIQKKYLFLLSFCVLHIVLIFIINTISYNNPILTQDKIDEFDSLAKAGNATAMTRLVEHYLTTEGFNATVGVFGNYKDVSHNFKKGFYRFLFPKQSEYADEIIIIALELAQEGDIYAQENLVHYYTDGKFVEQNLTKANYWAKVAECNKQGKSTQECQEIKEE